MLRFSAKHLGVEYEFCADNEEELATELRAFRRSLIDPENVSPRRRTPSAETDEIGARNLSSGAVLSRSGRFVSPLGVSRTEWARRGFEMLKRPATVRELHSILSTMDGFSPDTHSVADIRYALNRSRHFVKNENGLWMPANGFPPEQT
jgi:hypothetical protein